MDVVFGPDKNKQVGPKKTKGPFGPFGSPIDHFGPRRGLRPSLRWGQKWSSFWPEMLVLLRVFLLF